MRKVYKEKVMPVDESFDPWYESDFAQILTNKQLYTKIIDFVR
jgi:hypothetical protein